MSLTFADKGPDYISNSTPAERVECLLKSYGLSQWGFAVFRCTYGVDARWVRFVTRLNTHNEHNFREVYHKPDSADALDWSVQEDLSLHGAAKDEIRRQFNEWVY